MSFFDRANPQTVVGADDIAFMPRLGFLGALEAAYEAEARANSAYGLQQQITHYEEENRRRIVELGEEPPPPIGGDLGASPFFSQYRTYIEAAAAGNPEMTATIVGNQNERLRALQAQYPNAGILTYDEIWTHTKNMALFWEARTRMSPATFGGRVGAFVGAAAGNLNPQVNPFNFASLGIGGFGKTILSRIATEAAAQAGAETVSQFAWVRQQRDILGLPQYTAPSILLAGAAGGALRGIGEGVRVAAGRWFRPTPPDPTVRAGGEAAVARALEDEPPLPPSPPPGTRAEAETPSRVLREHADSVAWRETFDPSPSILRRTVADTADATRQLDRWDGPSPSALRVATEPLERTPGAPRIDLSRAAGETLDDVARRFDPETFKIYDNVIAKSAEAIRQLEGIEGATPLVRELNDISMQMHDLVSKLRGVTGRARDKLEAKLQPELDALIAKRTELLNRTIRKSDDVDARLVEADIKRALNTMAAMDDRIREITPSVERAYARTRGQFGLREAERADIARAAALHAPMRMPETPEWLAKYSPEPEPVNPTWAIPRTERSKAADPVDAAVEDAAARAKETADLAEDIMTFAKKELDNPVGAMSFRIDGEDIVIRLDEEVSDGVTMRQLLKEIDDDNTVLKAVRSCSGAKTS